MMNDDDARTLVRACLVELGIDVTDPIEVQKDLAFLRDHRLATEKLGMAAKIIALSIFISGGLGLIWLGFKGHGG